MMEPPPIDRSDGNSQVWLRADSILYVRVWQRPDLSVGEGARLGALMAAEVARRERQASGLLFDAREAPVVTGPKTQGAISGMLSHYTDASKPVAILCADEPVQLVQMSRLVKIAGPLGVCSKDADEVENHLLQALIG